MANETQRSKSIQCRITDEEYKEIEEKATKLGLSVGSYVRMVSLSKSIQCIVTDEEYKEIEEKATKIGLSVSSYVKMVSLMSEANVTLKPPQSNNNK